MRRERRRRRRRRRAGGGSSRVRVFVPFQVHCGPNVPQKQSPFAGRAKPLQTRSPALRQQDGTFKELRVTGVLDRTVWLQPQYLFHALTRAMYPAVPYLRYGRRHGHDPKENLLTWVTVLPGCSWASQCGALTRVLYVCVCVCVRACVRVCLGFCRCRPFCCRYNAKAEESKAATAAAIPKAQARGPQFAVCLAQASVFTTMDRFYELLRQDLLYSGRSSLKVRVLSYHRKRPPTPSPLIPEAPDEADLRGSIPKTGVRVTADMRTLSLLVRSLRVPWRASLCV